MRGLERCPAQRGQEQDPAVIGKHVAEPAGVEVDVLGELHAVLVEGVILLRKAAVIHQEDGAVVPLGIGPGTAASVASVTYHERARHSLILPVRFEPFGDDVGEDLPRIGAVGGEIVEIELAARPKALQDLRPLLG